MAWIKTIEPARASGLLRKLYDAALERAGKIYNIVRVQSLRPRVLRSSVQLYLEVMHSEKSGLSRAQREMIATTVSQINDCHYWIEAHAEDLRAEVQDNPGGEELVQAIKTDYRTADLGPADRAMLDFVAKLTRAPREMSRADLDGLRALGFDDAAIHDVVQVTALFAYFNRLADGLGVELEPEALS